MYKDPFFLFGDNEMAISKLMHMKETEGNPARHLKKSNRIRYESRRGY